MKLRPGDIILWGSKNGKFDGLAEIIFRLQNRFDGRASHAEMVYEYHSPDMVKTMGANFDGVKWRGHIVDKPYVAVIRPTLPMIPARREKELIIRATIREYYKKMKLENRDKYDYIGLIDAAINVFLHKISFKKYKKRKLFSGTKYPFCSESVSFILKDVFTKLDTELTIKDSKGREIPLSIVSPSDLYKDRKNFKVIKDFEI